MHEAILSTTCILFTAVIFSLAFSGAIFWPLQSVAVDVLTRGPKYRLADLFILTFQIQILVAIWYLANMHREKWEIISGSLFWSVLCVVWWWQGLGMLERAKVNDDNKRWYFLAIFCPAGHLASLSMVVAPFWFLGAFVTLTVSVSLKEIEWLYYFGAILVGGILHTILIFSLNRTCHFFVPNQDQDEAVDDPYGGAEDGLESSPFQ